MMKIEINLDPKIKETLVKVYAKEMNEDVEAIHRLLDNTSTRRLVGFKDDQVVMLDQDKVIRFMTKDKKVFAETDKEEYLVRSRLFELEERLKSSSFIRISQSELVNLDFIVKLDLSFQGTIAIEFRNKKVSYVSRRSIKQFKRALGL